MDYLYAMKIKEVIVLAFLNGTTFTPLLLTYENETMYLHISPQGCALFGEDSPEPFYRIEEPLLLAQGVMTDSKAVHLVVLKANGELCYTLISGTSAPRTTVIAKLDVRTARYRQLFLLSQGNIIHIFYAYSHQTISNLWRIEHRFQEGSSWHSVHLGEVVHAREPLYHVNLDSKGNIHLLTMTFQRQYSLLFTNRFNGTFHIWGSPTETLKILGEVVDMAALMTSDNVQHLFWVVKTTNGQFELCSALQTDAHNLTSTWHPSPSPIETFDSPSESIGALEINGVLWLLAHTREEVLMQNVGQGWKFFSSSLPLHPPLQWVHKGERNSHQTYWLEDQVETRVPAYHHELGLNLKKLAMPLPVVIQPPQPQAPPPVPAFYPEISSPSLLPTALTIENELNTLNPSETIEPEDILKKIDQLEQENPNLSLTLHNLFSKFDQILGIISENVIQSKQETPSAAPPQESEQAQTLAEAPLEEIKPLKQALSNLEKENQSLSQALRMMLTKQEENDSSIDKLESQICLLQVEKEDVKSKGGFWNKWFT